MLCARCRLLLLRPYFPCHQLSFTLPPLLRSACRPPACSCCISANIGSTVSFTVGYVAPILHLLVAAVIHACWRPVAHRWNIGWRAPCRSRGQRWQSRRRSSSLVLGAQTRRHFVSAPSVELLQGQLAASELGGAAAQRAGVDLK